MNKEQFRAQFELAVDLRGARTLTWGLDGGLKGPRAYGQRVRPDDVYRG